MNNRTRIGVIVLLAAGLLLALTIPGMAAEGDGGICVPYALVVKPSGETFEARTLDVRDAVAVWESDDLLVNQCEGKFPFGQQISPGLRYATFEEVCGYFGYDCTEDKTFTLEIYNPTVEVKDPDSGGWYPATYMEMTLFRHKRTFMIYKEYSPQ